MPLSARVGATVDRYGLAFPILGFWMDVNDQGEPRNERFREFHRAEEFGVATGEDLRLGRRLGMTILDNAGQTFQIAEVSHTGYATPLWLRILMRLGRDSRSIEHNVQYDLLPRLPMSFSEAKARVAASIERNKVDWIDDEAVAGEDGEPARLEDLVAGAMDAVRKATTVRDLFERLDAAWPY